MFNILKIDNLEIINLKNLIKIVNSLSKKKIIIYLLFVFFFTIIMNFVFYFNKEQILDKKSYSYDLKVIYKFNPKALLMKKVSKNLGFGIELPNEIQKISAVREIEEIQKNLSFQSSIKIKEVENLDLYKIINYSVMSNKSLKDMEFLQIIQKLKNYENKKLLESLDLMRDNIPYLMEIRDLNCREIRAKITEPKTNDNNEELTISSQAAKISADCRKINYLENSLKTINNFDVNFQLLDFEKKKLPRGELRINFKNFTVGSILTAMMIILLYEVFITSIKTPKFRRVKK